MYITCLDSGEELFLILHGIVLLIFAAYAYILRMSYTLCGINKTCERLAVGIRHGTYGANASYTYSETYTETVVQLMA